MCNLWLFGRTETAFGVQGIHEAERERLGVRLWGDVYTTPPGFVASADDLGSASFDSYARYKKRTSDMPPLPPPPRHFSQWPLQIGSWPTSRRLPPAHPASSLMKLTSTQRATRPSTEVSMPDRSVQPFHQSSGMCNAHPHSRFP